MDNTRRRRIPSSEHSDRQDRIKRREIQDQLRSSSPRQEITRPPEAREQQSISLPNWLRQQSEQHEIPIFGLSGLESQRNQQLDQQSSNSSDSRSAMSQQQSELPQKQLSPQDLVNLIDYAAEHNLSGLRHMDRSFSLNDAINQLKQLKIIERSSSDKNLPLARSE